MLAQVASLAPGKPSLMVEWQLQMICQLEAPFHREANRSGYWSFRDPI